MIVFDLTLIRPRKSDTTMSVNPGKRFEKKFHESLDAAGVYTERIQDCAYWNGYRMVGNKTAGDFRCYIPASKSLKSLLIENKATSSKRIEYDRLEEHQHASLVSFDNLHRDAQGWVAVNFYNSVSVARCDMCFMVPIAVWDEYVSDDSRKSIPMDTFIDDDRIIECPKVKGAIYDMSAWLAAVKKY